MENLNKVITGVSIHFKSEQFEITQSGVLINDYVITTAGLIFPHLKINDAKSIDIDIYMEKNGKVHSEKGYMEQFCKISEIIKSFTQLDVGFDDITIKAYSYFLFIRLIDVPTGNFTRIEFGQNDKDLFRGVDVLTVSTPFGNPLFLNAYSKGIISKIVDENLFITDSRLSPGCEGGPIYMLNGSIKIIGLMLSPLMKSTESSGYNICVNFRVLHEAYGRRQCFPIKPSISALVKEEPPIHRVSSVVLPIRTPSMKGSSIIIGDNGLLVTCSHVIDNDPQKNVKVFLEGKSYSAKVLCCSSKDDILDIAFLQLNAGTQLPSCTFSDTNPIKGEDVYFIGYEYFSDKFLQLTSKGTVLNHEEGGPLYASCITHSGNSGGGLFREDGSLIAIVCGHIVEESSKQKTFHYCHGISMPISVMRPYIENFNETGDISHLNSLCATKDLILSKWHLFIKSKL